MDCRGEATLEHSIDFHPFMQIIWRQMLPFAGERALLVDLRKQHRQCLGQSCLADATISLGAVRKRAGLVDHIRSPTYVSQGMKP